MTVSNVRQYRYNLTAPLLMVVGGCCLLWLSAVPLIGTIMTYGSTQVVSNISQGRGGVARPEVLRALEDLESVSWARQSDRVYHNQKATLSLRLFEDHMQSKQIAEATQALSKAREQLIEALRQAPGSANLWYLLAETQIILEGVGKKAIDSLQMSYLTGQREYWVLERRIKLALRVLPSLDDSYRKMVKKNITLLRPAPKIMSIYKNADPQVQAFILDALKTEPNKYRGLLNNLSKISRQ